jgi:hypothetical protein
MDNVRQMSSERKDSEMSRFEEGDGDNPSIYLWESNVKRGVNGKRGQAFLRELRDILLGMPEKRLIDHQWITPQGEVCVLGAYLRAKEPAFVPEDVDGWNIDMDEREFAKKFNLPWCMIWEIGWKNDNARYAEAPEERYMRLLNYVESMIREEVAA